MQAERRILIQQKKSEAAKAKAMEEQVDRERPILTSTVTCCESQMKRDYESKMREMQRQFEEQMRKEREKMQEQLRAAQTAPPAAGKF